MNMKPMVHTKGGVSIVPDKKSTSASSLFTEDVSKRTGLAVDVWLTESGVVGGGVSERTVKKLYSKGR
jgi:hypothetical protein